MGLVLALAGPWGLALGAGEAPAAPSKDDQQLLAPARGYLQSLFNFPGGMPVDEDIRKAMGEISRRHQARMAERLPQWLEEVRRDSPTPLSAQETLRRVFARLVNELVLWRLEPSTPQHDAPLLAAMQQPGLCVPPDQQLNALTFTAMALQRVPPAQRAAVLAEEERLLQRWGTPRQNLPEVPLVTAGVSARQAAARLRLSDSAVKDLPPMVPAMFAFLMEPANEFHRNSWSYRCAQAQWALRGRPAGAESLAAFRYEMALLFLPPTVGMKDESYPFVARMLGAEGEVRLRLRVNAQGQVLGSEVIGRNIHAAGVRNNPPLGLSALLDDAAEKRARAGTYPPEPGDPAQDGTRVLERSFEFQMPPDATAGLLN